MVDLTFCVKMKTTNRMLHLTMYEIHVTESLSGPVWVQGAKWGEDRRAPKLKKKKKSTLLKKAQKPVLVERLEEKHKLETWSSGQDDERRPSKLPTTIDRKREKTKWQDMTKAFREARLPSAPK